MAAAAYGAVVSLMHVLDNLQHPSRQNLHFDRHQIKTLSENLSFLLGFLEDYSELICHIDTIDLARQIAYAVDEAEEIIDYHVVNQLSQGSTYEVDMGLSSFREDMERVLNKIESIKKELMMVKDQERAIQPRVSLPASVPSVPPLSGKINTMVGFDDRLVRIMDKLTGDESDLQIVPITGMGGIGKTTLAQNVFDNRRIVDRFDLRKWITISQSYSIQYVLLGLLGELDNQNKKESNQILAELGGKLHKMLFGRRYLIVMDDVWSTQVWDELTLFLPENRNGSRILVTTRLSRVAVSLGYQNPYLMDFLDEETSWNLFCIKAFGKEVCPDPKLEEIGKNIVKCCKGLPLAIATIGGLLGKSNMIRDDWELVAKDVLKSLSNPKDVTDSIDDSEDDGDCSNILSLSYKHLPIHLKSCFLYMRVFPEDAEIYFDDLIGYWIAEGFVKPKEGKTLEEVAREYLKDLIDRNLILIHQLDPFTGDIWACKVHDLLRDLCIREYEKEFVFRISKVEKFVYNAEDNTCFLCCYRRASTRINLPQVNTITPLETTLVSCFVCDVCNVMCSNHNRLRLVKVAVDDDSREYLKPTRLRYLEISSAHEFESTVLPLLWNLQFLDLCCHKIELPTGIWEMPQLRHLEVDGTLCVDPPSTQTDRKDDFNLENLQCLKILLNFGCAEEILKRIPNVKELVISYRKHSDEFNLLNHPLHNVADLHKLHRLTCASVNLEYISFPNSLKILRLERCNCPWERMTIVGSLPNLEVLFLQWTVGGPEWNPIEGEFLRLKTLAFWRSDLVQWNAEKYHFPRLEILRLGGMKCLKKIPSGIGDVETLREIGLYYATESAVQSAEEIIAEQRDYGNEELQLIIKMTSLISEVFPKIQSKIAALLQVCVQRREELRKQVSPSVEFQ